MEIDKKAVGTRITLIRNTLNETLEEFGRRFNTSKTTVYNWEAGRNLPNNQNFEILEKIAEDIGISGERLLKGSPREYITDKMTNELELDTRKVLPNQIVNYYTEELKSNEEYYPTDEEIIQAYNEIIQRKEEHEYRTMLLMARWLHITRESINRFVDKTKENNSLNDEEQKMVNDIQFNLMSVYQHYSIIHGLSVEDALEELEELRDKQ